MNTSDRSARRQPGTADAAAPWPFRPVYFWDTPSRTAPLLVLVALLAVVVRFDPSTFHRSFDVAMPLLAIFWLMWPLLGPSRPVTLQQWRHAGQLVLAKRWMPVSGRPSHVDAVVGRDLAFSKAGSTDAAAVRRSEGSDAAVAVRGRL